jgi:hypothetical protein
VKGAGVEALGDLVQLLVLDVEALGDLVELLGLDFNASRRLGDPVQRSR